MANRNKVICIGWHKTGTSTLGDALIMLGYNVLGSRLDLAEDLLKSNKETALNVASSYDALQDVPWAALYKDLDTAFPNSKFIFTFREEDSWLKSAVHHFGKNEVKRKIFKWLYGYSSIIGHEEAFKQRYRKHNEEVLAYFKNRTDDFLIMDLSQGDGWEKLCKFLNKPIPQKPFPHSNKGKHNFSPKDKLIYAVRNITPKWLKTLRINLLVKLGYPDRRDRFNNKKYNRPVIKRRQNQNN